MTRRTHLLLFGSVAAALIAGVAYAEEKEGDENEQKVELTALPDAVRATAEANAQGGKLTEAEVETENGQQIYEIDAKKPDGTELEIKVSADGKLIKVENEADEEDEDDEGKEETIQLNQAPQEVQAAITKVLGDGGKLAKLEKESEHGSTKYEAEYTIAEVEHSVTLAEDGTIIEQESVVPSTTKAATAAIQKKYPTAKVVKAEEVTQHFYEVEITVDGKKHEVKVDASGKIQGGDDEDGEDEDDNDK